MREPPRNARYHVRAWDGFTLGDVGTPVDFGGKAFGDRFDLATTEAGAPVLAITRRDEKGRYGQLMIQRLNVPR